MRGSRLLLLAVLGWSSVTAPAAATDGPLPWEVWKDPLEIARLRPGDRVVMRSSHCPEGCRYDRHAPGDSRFLRVAGDEGVIFEAEGAGAITRIWMTMGRGVARPLPRRVSLRITLDGAAEPAVDLPLASLFAGGTAPFDAPLVVSAEEGGGGNLVLVPIPFRDECRVSLVGAAEARIWFQVTAHLLGATEGVVSFTGEEDLGGWRRWLGEPELDPWPGGPFATASGSVAVAPGAEEQLLAVDRADVLNGLLLRAEPSSWDTLILVLRFDGRETVRMPLADFFGVASGGAEAMRSVMLGATADGDLYCYFPMPFRARAEVAVARAAGAGSEAVELEYAIRRLGRAPDELCATFGAQSRLTPQSTPGVDLSLLELRGAGKWVGLFADMGSATGGGLAYLEGDERVFVDGERSPSLHGTGVEDFFGGGFYFSTVRGRQQSFRRALNGLVDHRVVGAGGVASAMYRLLLTDAPRFSTGIRAGFENGPTNGDPLRARTVACYYLR